MKPGAITILAWIAGMFFFSAWGFGQDDALSTPGEGGIESAKTVRRQVEIGVARPIQDGIDADMQDEEQEIIDGEIMEAIPIMGNPFGDLGLILGAKQFYLTKVYSIEIKRIDEICSLDPTQKTKLKIGMKGVVNKLTNEFRKSGLGDMIPLRVDDNGQVVELVDANSQEVQGEPAGDENEIEVVEVDDVNDVPEFTWQMIEMGNGPDSFLGQTLPTEEAAWLKIVKSTLTEEQYTQYLSKKEKQANEVEKATVDLGLKQFEAELALNAEQVASLRTLIEPQVSTLRGMPKFYDSFRFLFAAAKVDEDKLREILDDDQYQRLLIVIMPIKSMFDSMDEIGDMDIEDPEVIEVP